MPPSKQTPMLRQYLELKDQYPDCLLFYRMGDFFELFFEDAKVASQALEITLTSRNKNDEEPIPMCGVPHHSANGYIARLVELGFSVAICEQMEDPRQAKGLVARDVIKVVTPGTQTDPDYLPAKENHFLAAADPTLKDGRIGLAFLDLSTGQFGVREAAGLEELATEISRLGPAEILLPESFREKAVFNTLAAAAGLGPGGRVHVEFVAGDYFDRRKSVKRILEHFKAPDLASLEIDHLSAGLAAAGAVLAYISRTQRLRPGHIVKLEVEDPAAFLQMDEITQRHLELFNTLSGGRGKGTLIHVLDRTRTAMGGRLLRRWLAYPLQDLAAINGRQSLVAALFEAPAVRAQLREALGLVSDLERLCGRIVMSQAGPRDLVLLKGSIEALPTIKAILAGFDSPMMTDLAEGIDPLTEIGELIGRAVVDEPPVGIKEGGIIKAGYSPELDEIISLRSDGERYILSLEERERERTAITSLKVRYNRVFGYYIEVSKSNLTKVPDDYLRKQTLVNAERFITPELKDYEEKVLAASERQGALEYQLFTVLREELAGHAERIKATAALMARIDALASLAEVAQQNDYRRPRLDDSGLIELVASRHPVVEAAFTEEPFVPNDIHLDMTGQQLLILTGPNMSGKSTLLRQVGLCAIMAQMGGFIPADEAAIGVVDRIFTRVGAGDELAKGRSTFMVEMSETARILTQATPRSLVLLDEIGRGTSTFDGLSLAWAVAEYLHDVDGQGVKTIMATHYHELVELAASKRRAKNFTVAVKKVGTRIVFLRTLTPGGVSRSYGIEVARLAGLPPQVIARAREVLAGLEEGAPKNLTARLEDPEEPSLFAPAPFNDSLRQRLEEVEIDQLSPLEALNILAELKELV